MQANKELNNQNSKISKQIHIIEEIAENGETKYNCTACKKSFRSRSQRYYHINCNQLQNLIYNCEHCDKSFARRAQWKYHTESHISPVNECHKCQKVFSNPLALKKHVGLHEVEPKTCTYCDKSFKKKISLDQHIASQHFNQLAYGCAYCSKKYASKSTLQLHLQTHEKKRFECTFCGKLFQRNSILNLHLKRHYKTNRHICSVCQKAFSESGALARHRKTHEESVPQYYCKLCDKSIQRKDNMRRHLNTIHPGEKFDDIVEIMRLPMVSTKLQATKENQLTISKSDKQVVVIENKLLHKPIENKEYIVDLSQNMESRIDTIEYPLKNQIKVITAIPNKEICDRNIENISQEIVDKCKNSKHKEPEESTQYENAKFNGDFIKEQNNYMQPYFNKSNQTHHSIFEEDLNKYQHYFHTHKHEVKNVFTTNMNQQQSANEPLLTQTFSSVIRSVGNVEKNLTPRIDTFSKVRNPASLEYKHKKYCHSQYNIELYRKILGCDEDDDNEDGEKQQKLDYMLKSSTPVHWRKCFKNNYETSAQ